MSAFIVAGGALLEVGCPSQADRSTEQQVSFTSTLGGKRKAFIRKGGRRSWSIDVSVARPPEVSTIEAVARNLGPVGWYGPEAVIGNLFSPQASGWDVIPANGTDAGLVQLPDGTAAKAVVHSGSGTVSPGRAHGNYEMVPVRPGQSVTVGGWGMGGIRFSGFWRDANQQPITNFSANAHAFTGWQWREDTLTPPAGTAFVSLALTEGTQYARPSVSWGSVGRDELGTGCPKAVIHAPQYSPVALWPGTNITDSSYTVTEVG